PGHAPLAVIANALGALVVCLHIPTIMTAVYNQAKRSLCTLRFHVATEGSWDVGAATGCLLAALLSALGVQISAALLLPLPGAAPFFILLRSFYGRHPLVREIPVAVSFAKNEIVNLGDSAEG